MNDLARQLPAQSDNDRRIPIKDVLPVFRTAGIPRDIRSLQRYCESGLLDGIKELTSTGDTWFVLEASITPAITQLKQMHEAKTGRQTTTPIPMSPSVVAEPSSNIQTDNDGLSSTQSDIVDTETQESTQRQGQTGDDKPTDMSNLVAQYNRRIEDKDSEIEFYREELKERNSQIRDMKSIIDGQNELLGAINRSSEKIFTAIAEGMRKTSDANKDEETDQSRKLHVIETHKQKHDTEFETEK